MVTKYGMMVCLTAGLLFEAARGQSYGDPTRTDLGVGAAALGIANNSVAAADDLSSLLWNPAGLSTGKSRRRLQLSLGGQRPASRASLDPAGLDWAPQVQNTRIRFGNIGYATTSGRRHRRTSFGVAYQSPYSLDALLDYRAAYSIAGDQVVSRNQYFALGNLDFWTAGASFEVARGVFAGAAVSLVTGAGREELRFEKLTNGVIKDARNDYYHLSSERQYAGYDARLGLMVRSCEALTLGLRLELPSVVAFNEYGSQSRPSDPASVESYALEGYLKSYYAAAAGVAVKLPLVRLVSEINARAPLPREGLLDPQRYWKLGMGAGLEVDLLPRVLRGRAGYAWREYDPNPYLVTYRDPVTFDPAPRAHSITGDHTLSVGGTLRFGERVALDAAYAHRLWRAQTGNTLTELNQSQQGLASVTFQF